MHISVSLRLYTTLNDFTWSSFTVRFWFSFRLAYGFLRTHTPWHILARFHTFSHAVLFGFVLFRFDLHTASYELIRLGTFSHDFIPFHTRFSSQFDLHTFPFRLGCNFTTSYTPEFLACGSADSFRVISYASLRPWTISPRCGFLAGCLSQFA